MTKNELRKIAAGRVGALSTEDKEQKSRIIFEKVFALGDFEKSKNVLFYFALYDEVRTADAIEKTLSLGKNVYLPRVVKGSGSLEICSIGGCAGDLCRGCFGIMEPKPDLKKETDISVIDAAVAPGVVFDEFGGRIGRGRGYYDRFLSSSRAVKIGVAFDEQLTESIPLDGHDVRMDYVVTDSRIIKRTGD